jgi:hypothetical protein
MILAIHDGQSEVINMKHTYITGCDCTNCTDTYARLSYQHLVGTLTPIKEGFEPLVFSNLTIFERTLIICSCVWIAVATPYTLITIWSLR